MTPDKRVAVLCVKRTSSTRQSIINMRMVTCTHTGRSSVETTALPYFSVANTRRIDSIRIFRRNTAKRCKTTLDFLFRFLNFFRVWTQNETKLRQRERSAFYAVTPHLCGTTSNTGYRYSLELWSKYQKQYLVFHVILHRLGVTAQARNSPNYA